MYASFAHIVNSTNYSKLVDEILQSHLGHVIPRTGGKIALNPTT